MKLTSPKLDLVIKAVKKYVNNLEKHANNKQEEKFAREVYIDLLAEKQRRKVFEDRH